ncbi:sugar ABC transporter permease [Cohnella kolymensis]|uniref:Sugar ABC transporter permease n=1 Tax=Cohnella kolymensis TaxID=1590652 RepID=A0ABR5A6M7_9BACL|nr:sugar ABC transporter permease [Cohnella kolymensis]KIL36735.1 sugar ABC transporter permease [Cohnella kolymensis]
MAGQRKWNRRTAAFLFLLPAILGLMLLQLVPMIASIVISFTDWDLLTNWKQANFVGWDNYTQVFKDEKSYTSLLNVFVFLIGYMPLVMVFGVLFAVLLNRNIRGVKFYRAAIFVPVITSWVAVSIVWRWLLNGQSGIVNYLLSLVGIQGPVWLQDPTWAMAAVIAVTVWKDVGFVSIILLAGLQDISDDYYEASELDGASAWNKFRNITLPMLTPSLFFVMTISLINSFQLFDQVLIMTNGGPAGSTSTIVEQVYKNAFQFNKMGFASAQSWVLFVIIFAVTFLQQWLQKRWVVYER